MAMSKLETQLFLLKWKLQMDSKITQYFLLLMKRKSLPTTSTALLITKLVKRTIWQMRSLKLLTQRTLKVFLIFL